MKKKTAAILLSLILLFGGCAEKPSEAVTEAPSQAQSTAQSTAEEKESSINASEMFTSRDKNADYDASSAVSIKLSGNTATASSSSVQISGSTVKITEEATYIISGVLENGQIIVEADSKAKPQLVLSGVDITSKTSAALYVIEADKAVVTLAENTENTLANSEGFTADSNIDGAVFSKADLTFNGSGKLTVTSPKAHGIVCKDDLVFAGGEYAINAAYHGLDANDSVRITDSSFNIASGKDGIHSENSDDTSKGFVYVADGSFELTAEGDGISASASMQIDGGEFNITAGGGSKNGSKQSSANYGSFMGGKGGRPNGGKGNGPDGFAPQEPANETADSTDSASMKGLKSGGALKISQGGFTINSADDGVHTNSSMIIENGSFSIATGDDGFHADEKLTISGGNILITESYEGIEGLNIVISGGEITLTASDDGLNAAGGTDSSGFGGRDNGKFGGMGPNNSGSNGSIAISGGTLDITASGDGIDSNGTFEMTGGAVTVCGPTQGDTATLDFDKTGTISGGTFIGTGASNMAQSFDESEQGVITVGVGNASADTEITLKSSSGKVILTHKPKLGFQVVILSSPEIEKGKAYSLTVGSQTAQIIAD